MNSKDVGRIRAIEQLTELVYAYHLGIAFSLSGRRAFVMSAEGAFFSSDARPIPRQIEEQLNLFNVGREASTIDPDLKGARTARKPLLKKGPEYEKVLIKEGFIVNSVDKEKVSFRVFEWRLKS